MATKYSQHVGQMPEEQQQNASDLSQPTTDLNPNVLKYAMKIEQEIASDAPTLQPRLRQYVRDELQKNKETASQGDNTHRLEPVLKFLASPDADIVEPANETDLTQPMSQYFISSSHNTYLTGNQLYSDASVDGYMKVLKAGCRCVEIDVWDGHGPSDESIGEEVQGLRDKLSLLRSSGRDAYSHSDDVPTERGPRGLRERLGLHKNRSHDKAETPAAASESRPEVDNSKMPTPWKASSDPTPEPRVLHGHTLTREITFRQVCEAIKATGFASSDMPIIVSLEVHCNLEQQAIMVDIMQQVWRDHLLNFTRFATGNEPEYTAAPLPSPEKLQNKILIKVKYTPPEKVAQKHAEGEKVDSESSEESEALDSETQEKAKPQKKKKMLDELSLLGVYTRSFHFKNFWQSEAKVPTHVFALSENKLTEAIEKQSSALSEHNKTFFMRAYPKGVRVSSSNLNPIPIWRHGVQMVALNWQRCDKSMMLNDGMFGGTQGWVLKPTAFRAENSALREAGSSTASEGTEISQTTTQASLDRTQSRTSSITPTITHGGPAMEPQKHLDLTIRVYAAQDLPMPNGIDTKSFRPYVKCILHTEALSSQRKGRSRSNSRSPSPHPHHGTIGSRDTAKQSARERASSLLHDYAHRRGRSTASNSDDLDKPPPTKAKPKCKARTLTQRGTSPDFGGEALKFESVPVVPEAEYLTFIRVKVMHDVSMGGDLLAGWACVRLGRLRKGWGFLRVKDKYGQDTRGKVLIMVGYALQA